MPHPTPTSASGCPPWCAGHDDDQEPTPPRWHRSEGIIVPVVERRQARLGGAELAPLLAEDFVLALEQDERATYLYIGSLEDGSRFFAVTLESALRLHKAMRSLLAPDIARHPRRR